MFDRKSSNGAFTKSLCTALYLWLCRVIAEHQPYPPRFFQVVGDDLEPYVLIEIDIHTGDQVGEPATLDSDDWCQAWEAVGLKKLRDDLRAWMEGDALF